MVRSELSSDHPTSHQKPEPDRFDFYGPQYSRFDSPLARELRREVYGVDIGQQGWRTAAEQAEIARLLDLRRDDRVLDVACGSGGPSLDLVERLGCHLVGVDAQEAGIAQATAQAAARGLADRARFSVLDCGGPLPFADRSFTAVLCIDAINHLPDRLPTLAEWARVLRPGGWLLFTDPAVLTGAITKGEIDLRAATGFFMFVPQGQNERAVEAAGLSLVRLEDRSQAVADLAARWHGARARRADLLRTEEGAAWFEQRQRFLEVTAELASSRRLSRFLYLARQGPPSPS